ncbi:MAG: hypothetical protein JWQ38_470 [Flavipsychrobacter sp.]|nr:hypothetical protein [Flavipsychrobacter sp.]
MLIKTRSIRVHECSCQLGRPVGSKDAVLTPVGLDLPYGLQPLLVVDVFDEPLIEDAKLEQVPSHRHALAAFPFHELGRRHAKQEGCLPLGEAEQLPAFPEAVTCELRGHALSI